MKRIIVNNVRVPIVHTDEEILSRAVLLAKKRGISALNPVIYKKSLDARRKNNIHYVCSVSMDGENVKDSLLNEDIRAFDEGAAFDLDELKKNANCRKKVIIVGSGPCGLFAGYILSLCGMAPLVIERGSDVDRRSEKIKAFWENGVFDSETNVQFGEGGAGTFSDGKLNTRIGDSLQRFILEVFAENGAPKDILYQAKPHIGTDRLRDCVKNIRNTIIKNGGSFLFDTCLTDIKMKDDRIFAIEANNSEIIDCDCLILALGHSSRDTYEMLYRRSMFMQQKPFAAGVRIEHSREFINKAQYGSCCEIDYLPTADYRLAYNGAERSCYSFCMCPGGVVVNASSEPDGLVVNGMSYHSRMENNSNSALVVSVRPEDFENESPMAGIEFQRRYERLAYRTLGGKAPVQLARDFVNGRASSGFDGVLPSFTGETGFADLRECLPGFVAKTLKDGLMDFDRKIKGFSSGGAVLTGVEMRTSAPLRMNRNENFESVSIKGVFPVGEGAGYAGGIMSAAIDGVKAAIKILQTG